MRNNNIRFVLVGYWCFYAGLLVDQYFDKGRWPLICQAICLIGMSFIFAWPDKQKKKEKQMFDFEKED